MSRGLQTIVSILLMSAFLFGQTFTFETDSLNHHINPGENLEIYAFIHNISSQDLSVRIIRTQNNLPAGMTSSLCNQWVCFPAVIDTMTFPYPPLAIPAIGVDSTREIYLTMTASSTTNGVGEVTVRVENMDNPSEYVELPFTISTQPTGLIEKDLPVSGNFQLYANYPNPFNPSTSIPFEIGGSKTVDVTLNIYNALGQKIAVLLNEPLLPGNYEITWDGLDLNGNALPTGVYFYEIRAGHFSEIRKMLMIK